MSPKLGVLALLEAKPGRGEDLGKFLEGGRNFAAAEPGTVTWYTFKISDTRCASRRSNPGRAEPGGRRTARHGT
jgi:hypothetical protein